MKILEYTHERPTFLQVLLALSLLNNNLTPAAYIICIEINFSTVTVEFRFYGCVLFILNYLISMKYMVRRKIAFDV